LQNAQSLDNNRFSNSVQIVIVFIWHHTHIIKKKQGLK